MPQSRVSVSKDSADAFTDESGGRHHTDKNSGNAATETYEIPISIFLNLTSTGRKVLFFAERFAALCVFLFLNLQNTVYPCRDRLFSCCLFLKKNRLGVALSFSTPLFVFCIFRQKSTICLEMFELCGIVGYIGPRRSTDVLLDGLSKLEYRGYDSAGIALAGPDGEIQVVKKRKAGFPFWRKRFMPCRRWTLTAELSYPLGNARRTQRCKQPPHSSARISLVHNGIIENYAQLKEHLMEHGYEFCSDTDTEVLVKLLDYNYHGEPLDAIMKPWAKFAAAMGLPFCSGFSGPHLFGSKRESSDCRLRSG